MLFDRLASRVFGADASCISPARSRAQHARPAEPVGLRHLRRSADRARARHRTPSRCRSSRQLLHAQEYWRVKGLRADVVILNEHPADYLDEMQHSAHDARAGAALGGGWNKPGRHVPAARRRHARGRIAICSSAVARVVLRGDLGDLSRNSSGRRRGCIPTTTCRRRRRCRRRRPPRRRCPCRRWSWRTASAGSRPTAANTSSCSTAIARRRCRGRTCWPTPTFGTIVSASGSGIHLGRQQPREPADAVRQRSDCRSDRRSDLPARRRLRRGVGRDARTAAAPRRRRPLGRPPCRRRHALSACRRRARAGAGGLRGAGRSGEGRGADARPTRRHATRRLSVFGYVEWCLGPPRAGERRFVVTEMDDADAARCWRATPTTRSSATAWRSGARRRRRGLYTGDRAEFVGRNRTLSAPAALFRERLAGRTGAGLDPVRGAAGRAGDRAGRIAHSVAFVLGPGARSARTRSSWRRATRPSRRPRRRSRRPSATWDEMLGAVQVSTPDDSFDLIVNRWLLVSDAELPHLGAQRPVSARRRVRLPRSAPGRAGADLRAAGPLPRAPAARGVAAVRRGRRAALVASAERTRHADALLRRSALAAVRGRQLRVADRRRVGAGRSRPVSRGAAARARIRRRPTRCRASSSETASLFEHCVRAIAHAMRYGAHGLPLIGSGDWNDGMNRVGHDGPRRKRVARLVSRHRAERVRADLRAPRAQRSRAALPQRSALAHRHARAGVGRRLVSPRLLRRRHAARIGAERGVQARFADAVVGGALGGGAAAPRRSARWTPCARIWCAATPSSCCC